MSSSHNRRFTKAWQGKHRNILQACSWSRGVGICGINAHVSFFFTPVLYPAAHYPTCWSDLGHPALRVWTEGMSYRTNVKAKNEECAWRPQQSKMCHKIGIDMGGWRAQILSATEETKNMRDFVFGVLKDDWKEQPKSFQEQSITSIVFHVYLAAGNHSVPG